jgi:hypothetical protein
MAIDILLVTVICKRIPIPLHHTFISESWLLLFRFALWCKHLAEYIQVSKQHETVVKANTHCVRAQTFKHLLVSLSAASWVTIF